MINYRCCAISNALNQRNLCRQRNVFLRKRAVDLPPEPFEDLNKIGGWFARNGHPACHGGIEVMVCTEEARQNNLPGTINAFSVWEKFLHLSRITNGRNILSVNDH